MDLQSRGNHRYTVHVITALQMGKCSNNKTNHLGFYATKPAKASATQSVSYYLDMDITKPC